MKDPMRSRTEPDSYEAFMSGKYAVDVGQHMERARKSKTKERRSYWVRAARHANHSMLECRRAARAAI